MFLRTTPFILAACVFAGAAEQDSSQLTGAITLAQALDAALNHNPDLATAAWDQPIAGAQTVQAELRPNPELALEAENIHVGGNATSTTRSDSVSGDATRTRSVDERDVTGNVEFTLRLSQLIELGGKRAVRIEAARQAEDVAAWDYEVARYQVTGEVVTRFTEVLIAQEGVRIAEHLHDLAENTLDAVAGQVEAGEAAPLEARRVRAEAARLRIELEDAHRTASQARIRLAATWGAWEAHFTEAVGDIETMPELPPMDGLFAAREDHPVLERWAAELERREAEVELAKAKAVPDLTLSLGYRAESTLDGHEETFAPGGALRSWSHTESDDRWNHSLVIEGSIPLPFFNRNQGNIEAARLRVLKGADGRRRARINLDTALAETHAAAEAARERAQALAEHVVPEFAATQELTQEGYERGKFGLLDLLDAERALADAELAETEARIAYVRALAQLENTLGKPLQDITQEAGSLTDDNK